MAYVKRKSLTILNTPTYKMIISILIPSIESRAELLAKLHFNLMWQIYTLGAIGSVEVIVEVDNKKITTGAKRNNLLRAARGKYIVFVDDDDWVMDYYVAELLEAAKSDADCFAINGVHTTNEKNPTQWFLSKDYENKTVIINEKAVYHRSTNHISPVKRCLAMIYGFPDKSNAEDKWYSDNLNRHLATEFTIEKPMYHYRETTQPKEYV